MALESDGGELRGESAAASEVAQHEPCIDSSMALGSGTWESRAQALAGALSKLDAAARGRMMRACSRCPMSARWGPVDPGSLDEPHNRQVIAALRSRSALASNRAWVRKARARPSS